MKRFLLFVGDNFYPCGGWDDFEECYDTFEEADEAGDIKLLMGHDWIQIVDTTTGNVSKGYR